MFNAQVVQGISFDPFTPLLVAAALYFVLTFVLTRIMNMIEGDWMPVIKINNLNKVFGDNEVLKDINLEINQGK